MTGTLGPRDFLGDDQTGAGRLTHGGRAPLGLPRLPWSRPTAGAR